MRQNMGIVDRVVRILAAVGVEVAYLLGYLSGTWAIVLGVVAVAFVVTSFVGWCPAYLPFGLSTIGRKSG